MSRLAATEVRHLDPNAFLAVVGRWVIHPGGRASTDQVPHSLLRRMARAVHYLGYIVVDAHRPLHAARLAG